MAKIDDTPLPNLLEISPYEADGGQRIGRDPRQISSPEFQANGIQGRAILEVIREKCLDCRAGQPGEVRKCVSTGCANWPYRMGTNPFRVQRQLTDEQRRKMAERLRNAAGKKIPSS